MSAEADHSLEQIVTSEHGGVRVWSIQSSSMQELIDQLAVVLGEHMADGDELHVAYNGMENGAEPRQRNHLLRHPQQWTELQFEYSALIVLRARGSRGTAGSITGGRSEGN
jgi:hypothetical protein